jgi:hypothetical protein
MVTVNENLLKHFKSGYEAFNQVQTRKSKQFGNRGWLPSSDSVFHQVANPMRKNTTSYREWQRGWDAAYFENLEKLNGLGARS